MYIPVSRINPASLTRSPHQTAQAASEPSALSFSETLAAVAVAIEEQARRIKKKYGLSVRISAVSKDGKESADKGTGDDLHEIVIAPNILQQMSKDAAMQRRVYGYLDEYTGQDPEAARHSLIIHRDGTCSRLVAPAPLHGTAEPVKPPGTGQADSWSGGSAHDRLQQIAFLRARRSNRRP